MQRRLAVLIGCAVAGLFTAAGAEAKNEAKHYWRHHRVTAGAQATKVKNLADPAQNPQGVTAAQAAEDPRAAGQRSQGGTVAAVQPSAQPAAVAVPVDAAPAPGAGLAVASSGAEATMPLAYAAAPPPANPPLPGLLAAIFQPRPAVVQQVPAPAEPPPVADAGGTTVVIADTPMRQLVAKHAAANGVPFSLAHAVVMIESKYAARVAHAGNYGLMQIRAETARSLGFTGSALGLLDPETNLRFGMKYLAMAYKMARGDTCGTVMRYQSGVMTTRMSAANRAYCARARGFMAHM